MIFTDECDRFKDLTHVHSFTHDFHLRMVQSHISGRPQQFVFKQGYHLTGFLQDLVTHYSVAPSFSRNYVHEGKGILVQFIKCIASTGIKFPILDIIKSPGLTKRYAFLGYLFLIICI